MITHDSRNSQRGCSQMLPIDKAETNGIFDLDGSQINKAETDGLVNRQGRIDRRNRK